MTSYIYVLAPGHPDPYIYFPAGAPPPHICIFRVWAKAGPSEGLGQDMALSIAFADVASLKIRNR